MAFDVSRENVEKLKKLAEDIPSSVEEMEQASKALESCYENVSGTVGPHSKEIKEIVEGLNRLLKESGSTINEIPPRLKNMADIMQSIIDKNPQNFR